MKIRAWASSDVGNVKKHNEDNFFVNTQERVFVVADGVSGRNAGEVASKQVVDLFERRAAALAELIDSGNPLEDDAHRERVLTHLTDIVQESNTAVYDLGKTPEYPGGMATTIVALALALGAQTGFVAHVGDSRIYLHRNEKIFRITEDHTYAEELKKRDKGHDLPPKVHERFSHVLTRSIGGRPSVDVDVVFFEIQPGDCFLLCTDGVTDYLSGSDILDFLKRHDPEGVVDALVHESKQRGGRDNITAVYVEVPHEQAEDSTSTTRIDTLRKINFLATMHLFEGLTHVELLRVLRVVYEQSYKKGEAIVRQSSRASAIYLIVEGSVAISRDGKHLTTLEKGAHFGELSMFQSSTSSVTVQSATDNCLVLALPATRFQTLVTDDPTLGNKLLWNIVRQLAGHVETMNAKVVEGGLAKTLELHSISRDDVPATGQGVSGEGQTEE